MQYYGKQMTADELAQATAGLAWLQQPSSSGLSVGAIAGIAVGAVAAAILVVVGLLLVMRRRRPRPVLDAESAMRAIKVCAGWLHGLGRLQLGGWLAGSSHDS